MLMDYQKVVVEYNKHTDCYSAYITPNCGRDLELIVDIDDGVVQFFVSYSSYEYDGRVWIEHWIKDFCDQFYFLGVEYNSIEDLSCAILAHCYIADNDEYGDVIKFPDAALNEAQENIKNGRG